MRGNFKATLEAGLVTTASQSPGWRLLVGAFALLNPCKIKGAGTKCGQSHFFLACPTNVRQSINMIARHKTTRITVRFTPDEMRKLRLGARNAKIGLSEHVRRIVAGKEGAQ